jgi:putative ABC transport system permease protein
MFWNNLVIALRNLRKNKVFAAMNIVGLAIGLTVYVFGGILVKYETTHDLSFKNAARVYTIGGNSAPELNVGFDKINSTFSAVGPLIESEIADVELVARTISDEYLVTVGDEQAYQSMFFADPAFTEIFDFNYLQGDSAALDDPSGMMMTESAAIRYFGRTDILGETVSFDNEFDFHVTAVIEDPPANTHFNSFLLIDSDMQLVLPMQGLKRMSDEDVSGNWDNLSVGNMTYVLIPDEFDQAWLQTQVNGIYDRLVPDQQKEVIANLLATPLVEANTAIWDLIGMPVIAVVTLLSLLVLVIACINYTNLATAQSMGRSREVGMRKTMGASQTQLLAQFLIESLVVATLAMIVAIALLEIIIPLFNNASGKVVRLDYLDTLPWLAATTVLVGLVAGAYPAWLITRASPIDALRDIARKGRKGAGVRAFMIGAQFAISAFMLAIVSVVYVQNQRVESASYEFPRSQIYTLNRLRVEGITDKLETLRNELESLPNVDSVAFSSQVPYEQNNSSWDVTARQGDEAGKFPIMLMRMTPEFFETYDIPILAGRNLNREMANDAREEESTVINVLVNEMALEKFGITNHADALGSRFYTIVDEESDSKLREMVIVGIVPTQNIVGLFNQEKPWLFSYDPDRVRIGSVRITGGNMMDVLQSIEDTWDRVIPNYPMQGRFLDEVFDEVFNVMRYMSYSLAGFAMIALLLALIGLFGLAAFMATQRTKEIGVRKVLGASSAQIAKLLVWQFSRPVFWALLVALPLAYMGSSVYLNFFADRIESAVPILIVAGCVAVLLAWATIAGHAIRIARANPIRALRYE